MQSVASTKGVFAHYEHWFQSSYLTPDQMPQVRKDCLSCIDQALLWAAKERQDIDSSKLLPILVDVDWNQWALLANQSDGDEFDAEFIGM